MSNDWMMSNGWIIGNGWTVSNHWIYIGADIGQNKWSKIGKTTCGLNTRHTSSQNPDYFIHTAFNIVNGNVHEIELTLLNYLESISPDKRQIHFSTGTKSECFRINPNEMERLVEAFIETRYSSCVTYEPLFNRLSRYQCINEVYRVFKKCMTPCPEQKLEPWFDNSTTIPSNLGLSRNMYFSNNQIEYETDLGDNHFVDNETGMQGYRYEDGSVEWRE